MKRKLSSIVLVVVFLTTSNDSSFAAIKPSEQFITSFQSGIMAPGPINPTPITGREVCRLVQTVMGVTGFWQSLGHKVSVWITIPVYGTSIVCTYVYY